MFAKKGDMMMKLKCWKKVSSELWENKRKKTELILDKLDGQWDVLIFKEGEDDPEMPFGVPTKKEATWLAHKYMKDHDRC
jgi:hypothetical protein